MPVTFPLIRLAVAFVLIQLTIVDDAALPYVALYSAATPATCGDAMDVPLIVLVADVLPIHVERIELPGA